MKIKQVVLAGTMIVSVATFAQKDELKALKKIYEKDQPSANDVQSYKDNLTKLGAIASEEGDKTYLNFFKAITPELELSALGAAPTPAQIASIFTPNAISEITSAYKTTLEYEKKSDKKIYTDDITQDISEMKPVLNQLVIGYDQQKNYKDAASVLYSIYQLDTKDQEKLYYAANYAVNAQDYDNALKYYQELKNSGYSGEGNVYYATNKDTKQEEAFTDKNQRDLMLKLPNYERPRDEKIASKKGEITKNIALIYLQQGKTEEAKTAFKDARLVSPDDTSLILSEAEIYYKLKDIATYKKLIGEALQKNPNDADLIYNLGVLSANDNQLDDAKNYYNKVLQLKPDYTNAYLNLADIVLKPDTNIVKEINKLGTSEKDLKQYESLKGQRQKIFTEAMPLLEKALELSEKSDLKDANNKDTYDVVKGNLISVYNFLEMKDKAKALKAKQ